VLQPRYELEKGHHPQPGHEKATITEQDLAMTRVLGGGPSVVEKKRVRDTSATLTS